MRNKDLKLVVDLFKFYIIQITKDESYRTKLTDNKEKVILNFIEEIKKETNATFLSEEYCRTFVEYQFNVKYKASGQFGRSYKNGVGAKAIQIEWIFGKAALKRWRDRTEKQKAKTGYIIRKGLKKEVEIKEFNLEHKNFLISKLNPKAYLFLSSKPYENWFRSKAKKINKYCDNEAHRPIANISQLYIKNRVLRLIKEQYDGYILTRFDLNYENNNFSLLFNNKLCFINNESHAGLSDLFLWTNRYQCLLDYTNMNLRKLSKNLGLYGPHEILKYWTDINSIPIKIESLPITIYGVRV